MTVAVKFCGGCNPRYDRAAVLGRLREAFPQATFGAADIAEPDYVLVLTGCPAACAAHDHLLGRYGKMVIHEAEQYPAVHSALEQVQRMIAEKQ